MVDRLIRDQRAVKGDRARAFMRVFEISNAFMIEKDLRSLLDLIVETVVKETKAERGSLMLLDPGKQELSIYAAVGLPESVIETARVVIGQGISGWVARMREPLILIGGVHPIFEIQEEMRNKQIGSGICVPMVTQGELIGVLSVSRMKNAMPFRQTDLELLSVLAGQAAIGIENARLYREASTVGALREADRLKTDLLANISHELRTPLASIKGYSTSMLRYYQRLTDEEKRDSLYEIDHSCDKLTELVENLLELSSLEVGGFPMKKVQVDIVNLIDQAMMLIA